MRTDINNMSCEAHEVQVEISVDFCPPPIFLSYPDATKLRNFLNKAIRKHNKNKAIKKARDNERYIEAINHSVERTV